jgi:hypothetical protein
MKTHIIVSDTGKPMELCEFDPGKPVLSLGDKAQTFTYSQARRALAKTRAYAAEQKLPWKAERYRAVRLLA